MVREVIGVYKAINGSLGGFIYRKDVGIISADDTGDVIYVDLAKPFVPVYRDVESDEAEEAIDYLATNTEGVVGILFTEEGFILLDDLTFFGGKHKNTTTGELVEWDNSGMSEVMEDYDFAEEILDTFSDVLFL